MSPYLPTSPHISPFLSWKQRVLAVSNVTPRANRRRQTAAQPPPRNRRAPTAAAQPPRFTAHRAPAAAGVPGDGGSALPTHTAAGEALHCPPRLQAGQHPHRRDGDAVARLPRRHGLRQGGAHLLPCRPAALSPPHACCPAALLPFLADTCRPAALPPCRPHACCPAALLQVAQRGGLSLSSRRGPCYTPGYADPIIINGGEYSCQVKPPCCPAALLPCCPAALLQRRRVLVPGETAAKPPRDRRVQPLRATGA